MASAVLAPVQERGRAALERLGLPTRRQEPWRLTDLKRLEALAQAPPECSCGAPCTPPPASAGVRTGWCSMVRVTPSTVLLCRRD